MINDTEEARDETVEWMKKQGLYSRFLSSEQMCICHEIYHRMKKEYEEESYRI